jgi:type IV secretory pathway VirD2 relaxase
LGKWQNAGDARMFKVIISPEFGERLDLPALTRRLMQQMEHDLGTKLQWVAVAHYNTEHPHVHVALRGIRESGDALLLGRDYVRSGVRERAEKLCTALLGYRTEQDAAEALRRETGESRYTSLDRLIKRRSEWTDGGAVVFRPESVRNREQQKYVRSRLIVLESMGLAAPTGAGAWQVRSDLETVLRSMQRAGDRQKALAAHAETLSDARLPLQATDLRTVRELYGRVIAHGEEEATGRSYMLLEGTDAKVHFIYHAAETEASRASGYMRPNAFVELRGKTVGGPVSVLDLGDAERILKNERHFTSTVQKMVKRGMLPTDIELGGWLGRYQATLLRTAAMSGMEGQRTDATRPGRGR